MKIDWHLVRAEHVEKACELTLGGQYPARAKVRRIVVRIRDADPPAKHLLRLAYCLAKGMPLDAEVKFTSGDGTISLLKRLGFDVQRREEQSAT